MCRRLLLCSLELNLQSLYRYEVTQFQAEVRICFNYFFFVPHQIPKGYKVMLNFQNFLKKTLILEKSVCSQTAFNYESVFVQDLVFYRKQLMKGWTTCFPGYVYLFCFLKLKAFLLMLLFFPIIKRDEFASFLLFLGKSIFGIFR